MAKLETEVREIDIRTILNEWRESRRTLYAIVFDGGVVHSCAGRIARVEDGAAVIADARIELRIPYATAGDYDFVSHNDRVNSMTLTWPDGRSAFLVTQ